MSWEPKLTSALAEITKLKKRINALEKVVFKCESCDGTGEHSYGHSDMGYSYEKCKNCKGTGICRD